MLVTAVTAAAISFSAGFLDSRDPDPSSHGNGITSPTNQYNPHRKKRLINRSTADCYNSDDQFYYQMRLLAFSFSEFFYCSLGGERNHA